MEESSIMHYVFIGLAVIAGLFIIGSIISAAFTVPQGSVYVVTRFGKYKSIALPGLNFKTPFLDSVFQKVSIQNRSSELKFQAITKDQANVHFSAMLLYAVLDATADVVQLVAFKFASDNEFTTAITKTIEGSVRSFVATKMQAEILSLRKELVESVKSHLDDVLKGWGYHLIDLQVNDIAFDQAVMESMSKVVASSNLLAAATNEGAALLITKTKAAEAEGNAIKIQAAAEKEAATLRGQGVASFRAEVAKGMKEAVAELTLETSDHNASNTMILFSMWTESIKNFAEIGKGNVIFLDGSTTGMEKTMNQLMGMNIVKAAPPSVPNGKINVN